MIASFPGLKKMGDQILGAVDPEACFDMDERVIYASRIDIYRRQCGRHDLHSQGEDRTRHTTVYRRDSGSLVPQASLFLLY